MSTGRYLKRLVSFPPSENTVRFPSRPVTSRQSAAHVRLEEILQRHTGSAYRKPIADRSRAVFQQLDQQRCDSGLQHVVLDAGCGTGESTLEIARQNPGTFVLGIDKSLHRLRRHGISETGHLVCRGNAVLAQMDCVDCWRLAREAGWRLRQHWLLYPNPWPKPRHIMRRWHAHPVFPDLIGLGGALELRTNWRIYADEFAGAAEALVGRGGELRYWFPAEPLTNFERKYRQSRLLLYRFRLNLDQ